MQDVVHRSPRLFGVARSTWRPTDLRQVIAWMHALSLPGICRLLRRLQVVYKRGRASVHSPELAYDQKLAVIAQAKARSQADPKRFPFLYEDETPYELRPRVSRAYAPRGRQAKLARQAATAKQRRIAASIEITTGVVIARQRSRFNGKRDVSLLPLGREALAQGRAHHHRALLLAGAFPCLCAGGTGQAPQSH